MRSVECEMNVRVACDGWHTTTTTRTRGANRQGTQPHTQHHHSTTHKCGQQCRMSRADTHTHTHHSTPNNVTYMHRELLCFCSTCVRDKRPPPADDALQRTCGGTSQQQPHACRTLCKPHIAAPSLLLDGKTPAVKGLGELHTVAPVLRRGEWSPSNNNQHDEFIVVGA